MEAEEVLLPLNRIDPPSLMELIWLAAAIDFDGAIGMSKNKAKTSTGYIMAPQVQFTNTDPKLVDKIRVIYVKIGVDRKPTPYTPSNEKWATQYHFCTQNHEEIIKILEAVEPFLISKKRQAQIVLDYCKSRSGKRGKKDPKTGKFTKTYDGSELIYYGLLEKLNKKGVRRNV